MSTEINMILSSDSPITFDEAKKRVSRMNLINGFMMDSVLENEEKGKIIVGAIISTVLDREIPIKRIESQKVITGLDSIYHGVRFDVYVDNSKGVMQNASVYDLEMEDRPADRNELPKRGRYYTALCDSKRLPANTSYNELPDYFAVTILSYDPFGAGDMYYEVRSVVTTHPDIEYMDGITRIFLYCKGKNNLSERKEYGERLQEVLEYIVDGAVRENPSRIVAQMNEIVTETKERAEVTEKYMQKWDELEHIKRDLRNAMADDVRREVMEEVTQEVKEKVTEEVTERVTEEVTERVTEEVTERVTEEVTERVTEEVTERVTEEVTERVTEEVTEKVTEEVTEKVTREVDKKRAKEMIDYGRLLGDSDENIRKLIVERYDFGNEIIEELLAR